MKKKIAVLGVSMLAALALSGCAMRTVEEMYALPRRSQEYSQLQSAIDAAMQGKTYCAPLSGENQQTVQTADLNGDGIDEYLVFALAESEKPLQVLIFAQQEDGSCVLQEVIQNNGTAFDQVEYVNLDEKPGCELVIGRLVSDQVMRSVSVYNFSAGPAQQLFWVGYSKFLTCDLDENGRSELLVLRPGESQQKGGVALLYSFQNGQVHRSVEAPLSTDSTKIRRISQGLLLGRKPAVFVSSSPDEESIVTDILTLNSNNFLNVTPLARHDTSIGTLHNYFVYAEDIDGDGVMELPSTIPMRQLDRWRSENQRALLLWRSMDVRGKTVDKLSTFHNFQEGWYLELEREWAEKITVVQEENCYIFYTWTDGSLEVIPLFRIYSFTDSNRDEEAVSEGRFALHRAEGIAYAARLEAGAKTFNLTEANLSSRFRLIRQDWRSGET